jgi:hypothetical protein
MMEAAHGFFDVLAFFFLPEPLRAVALGINPEVVRIKMHFIPALLVRVALDLVG